MVGSQVHVIAMRPVPLLYLMGLGGSLPARVCRATVKGVLAGGDFVQVDDVEIAPALQRPVVGAVQLPASCCYVERRRAVDVAVGELVDFLRGGFARCMDAPDAARAMRGRFAGLVAGEEVSEDVLQAARAVGLAS